MKVFKQISVMMITLLVVFPFLISCQHAQKTTDQLSESAAGTQVQKAEAPGIKNFSRIGEGAGFGGATQSSSMAWLKDDGFASVINLRFASEEGAELETSRIAAQTAGLEYIHMPLNPGELDQQFMNDFFAAVDKQANQPVYVHCGSATRAAAIWMIKRVVVDEWTIDEAASEAESIAGKPEAAIGLATRYIESIE